LITGIIVAVTCGVLSSFIVLRGMAFIGDAVAHSILPGVVLSYILGTYLLFGALCAAILSVFGMGLLSRQKRFKEDTAIGVIFTGAFALGILLMSKVSSFTDLSHILFGNILGVSSFDLVLSLIISCLVVFTILLLYKEFLVTSFDTTHATAIGLSPLFVHYILLILIAVTTVIATQAVGIVLVLALLVTPAAIGVLISGSLKKIIICSLVVSVTAVIMGFYISFHLNVTTGPGIVIILSIMFIISFIISKVKKRLL